ncbi:MAG: FAD-dependent oxidoreductase [Acidobacteriota bacterium]|nr:FAD-dependent oxidoreductase [Acidobacteriota bacterium]
MTNVVGDRRSDTARRRVAVVGAGAAGLVTACELLREGHEVMLLEAESESGGLWNFDATGHHPGRPLYGSLRTNLPTQLMALRDYPFEGERAFVDHADVLAYLQRFVADHNLLRHVRFEYRVEAVNRRSEHWEIGIHGRQEPVEAEVLVIANGHYRSPRTPLIQGLASFAGRTLHSHTYRRPGGLAERRVLLVGAGASAVDISLDLVASGATVHVATRAGLADVARFPGAALHPRLVGVEGHRLRFADGSTVDDIDNLLFCTGYRYDFPFLRQRPELVTWDEDGAELYFDLLSPADPTLAFIGLPFRVIPFPQFQIQARWLARALASKFELPPAEERAAWIVTQRSRQAANGTPRHHRMLHGEAQFAYHDQLARQCGATPLPEWFLQLHRDVVVQRAADPAGYRDSEPMARAVSSATRRISEEM